MAIRLKISGPGEEKNLILAIKNRDQEAFKVLYKQNFPTVHNFIRLNGGTEQEAKDIFQEAVMVFFHKLENPSFVLDCKIKTFLYSVSRRLWLTELKRKNRTPGEIEDIDRVLPSEETDLEEVREKQDKIEKMRNCLESLGEPCATLLKDFYMHDYSMQEIAEKMGYNNTDTAKNLKYKCLMRLKKMFFAGKHSKMEVVDYE